MGRGRKKPAQSNAGLGFIDLLAITLIVVILQTTAIIDRSDSEVPPLPVSYNVSVYQPVERAGASPADHLAYVLVGDNLLLWSREDHGRGSLLRDAPAGGSTVEWRPVLNWGRGDAVLRVFTPRTEGGVAAFVTEVNSELGIEFSITEIEGRPPRISAFFDQEAPAFTMEVGFHKCFVRDAVENRYQGRWLHPVLLRWSVLGQEVSSRTVIRELSIHNPSDWADGGQFFMSPVNDLSTPARRAARTPGGGCESLTALECAGLAAGQRDSLVVSTIEYDQFGLSITDAHGVHYRAR